MVTDHGHASPNWHAPPITLKPFGTIRAFHRIGRRRSSSTHRLLHGQLNISLGRLFSPGIFNVCDPRILFLHYSCNGRHINCSNQLAGINTVSVHTRTDPLLCLLGLYFKFYLATFFHYQLVQLGMYCDKNQIDWPAR